MKTIKLKTGGRIEIYQNNEDGVEVVELYDHNGISIMQLTIDKTTLNYENLTIQQSLLDLAIGA